MKKIIKVFLCILVMPLAIFGWPFIFTVALGALGAKNDDEDQWIYMIFGVLAGIIPTLFWLAFLDNIIMAGV